MPPPRTVQPHYVLTMLGLAALALGLLYTSTLNRRLIIGVFVVGWIGLAPYAYEPFASATHPPMNWGVPATRGGFYYEVTREQYPKSLPTLLKTTFGKHLGVRASGRQSRFHHRPARLLAAAVEDALLLRRQSAAQLHRAADLPDARGALLYPALRRAADQLVHLPARGLHPGRLHAPAYRAAGGLRLRAQPAVQGLSPAVALHFRPAHGLRRARAHDLPK
ncbi:MAG: hypothetical protein WDO13_12740 [Verrucomicrobiota bacterium]